MNPVQLAAKTSLLSVPQRPRIVEVSRNAIGSSPITIDIPYRRAGILALTFISNSTALATAATPTGWTSLGTNTSYPRCRIAYKFLNGSEAPTTTSAASSAIEMLALTFAIDGCISSRPPTATGPTRTAGVTTADPASHSTTAPYGAPLWLTYVLRNNIQPLDGRPIGFSTNKAFSSIGTTLSMDVLAENINQGTVDPSAFSFPSCDVQTGTICVRGA